MHRVYIFPLFGFHKSFPGSLQLSGHFHHCAVLYYWFRPSRPSVATHSFFFFVSFFYISIYSCTQNHILHFVHACTTFRCVSLSEFTYMNLYVRQWAFLSRATVINFQTQRQRNYPPVLARPTITSKFRGAGVHLTSRILFMPFN